MRWVEGKKEEESYYVEQQAQVDNFSRGNFP